jgi:hypothetical protein
MLNTAHKLIQFSTRINIHIVVIGKNQGRNLPFGNPGCVAIHGRRQIVLQREPVRPRAPAMAADSGPVKARDPSWVAPRLASLQPVADGVRT